MAGSQSSRALSFEEALFLAISLQKNGHLEEAELLYRELDEVAPDHADVLHYSGVLAHQMGRGDEALRLIERSLAIHPEQAEWHSNFGRILQERGQLEEAVEAYRRAVRLDPGLANAHANLGVLLKARGNLDEAEASYRTALRIAPDHCEALHNLGVLLAATGRAREAVLCFYKAITVNPALVSTRTLLALAYHRMGQPEKAIEIFERWVREEPGNPVPLHLLAACSGKDVPARASDAYVETTFDGFAASFDSKLAALHYRAPQLVAAALAEVGLVPARKLVILDAGCGTGLCGPLMAPYAARLVGVDLSGGMLAQARARRAYDELEKGELTAYLRAHVATYDVIVSADTLVYFGALDGVARAAAEALLPGGILVFTVEELVDGEGAGGFRIEHHGRYSHHPDYVRAVLADAGLRAEIAKAELRTEGGLPVAGLVVRAVKRRE
jgi:predicted TPR repeat methyltransferase